MDDESQTNEWPAGMTGRGLRGRRLARLMFVAAIAPAVLTGVLFLSTQSTMGGGMRTQEPFPIATIVVGAGILGYVVGLALMVRIYRADPEAGRSSWRFRDF